MAFPERLLAHDEEVVIHLHPHWKMLVMPVVWLVLVGGLAGFALALVQAPPGQLAIAAAALLLVCYTTVRPFLRWLTTHFVFTTHRVLLREGVLSRSGRDIALARINDVSFEHNLFERMLGSGTLVVESVGERGQIVLADVPRVERVQGAL
ncbi:MAG TPA: PH domain-containing protein, partial [Cryptosporangiaceae bacterium]|nr:PH domain-containing protein [Cryptosporangiaceae bacterium]